MHGMHNAFFSVLTTSFATPRTVFSARNIEHTIGMTQLQTQLLAQTSASKQKGSDSLSGDVDKKHWHEIVQYIQVTQSILTILAVGKAILFGAVSLEFSPRDRTS